jgi:hypothetical protein
MATFADRSYNTVQLVGSNLAEDRLVKKTALIAASLALLLAGGVRMKLIAREAPGEDAAEKQADGQDRKAHFKAAKAMLAAAKKTSDLTTEEYAFGRVTLTDVYAWSRRLLDAERNIAKTKQADIDAFAGHWQRMKRLHGKVAALFQAAVRGGEAQKLHATEFYVAEAELLLVDAGGTVPDKAQ